MSEETDDKINPDEWTQKELVKHLYRELKKLSTDMDEIKKWAINTEKIETLTTELANMSKTVQLLERARDKMQWTVTLLSTAAGVIGALIGLAVKVFGLF